MKNQLRILMPLLFLLPLFFACQAGQQEVSSEAELTPTLPTPTETPLPTPTATPTPEPVYSYYTNGDEVNAITVDNEGNLWAATNGGVVRWGLETGISTLFNRADGLPTNIIYNIFADDNGSIWAIASQAYYLGGTAVQYQNGEWISQPDACENPDDLAYTFTEAEDGLWIGCSYSVTFYDGQTWTHYTEADGLLGPSFREIYIEPEGRVWVGSGSGINWFEDDVWSSKKIGADELLVRREDLETCVNSITRAPNGAMWFGTGMGGARYVNGTWSYFTYKDGLLGELKDIEFDRAGMPWSFEGGLIYYYKYNHWFYFNLDELSYINLMIRSPEGGLWFGTRETGAMYLTSPDWILIDRASEALASDEVVDIITLEDGTTLFAHPEAGISRVNLEEMTLRTYQLNTGVPAETISTILPNPDGTLWALARGGNLYLFDGQQWENYSERNVPALGRALRTVSAILTAPDGTLWIGSGTSSSAQYFNDVQIASWDGEEWTPYTVEDGLFDGSIKAMANGPDGTIVAVNSAFSGPDGYSIFMNGSWQSFTEEDGFPIENPNSVVVDKERTIWIGSYNDGLLRIDQSGFKIFTAEDGLPGEYIYTLFVDSQGCLWVGTDQGLAYYDYSSWRIYTEEDGLAKNIVTNISQAPDGVLWVGTSAGASRFDGTTWQTLTSADGLGTTGIGPISAALDGTLWFATSENGLTRFGPPLEP
ncbi:MAG: hypothetical protein JXA25_17115 [Anaerolineales bacterium]|nr:hypothetical protein [Anaerolineales bacterium]